MARMGLVVCLLNQSIWRKGFTIQDSNMQWNRFWKRWEVSRKFHPVSGLWLCVSRLSFLSDLNLIIAWPCHRLSNSCFRDLIDVTLAGESRPKLMRIASERRNVGKKNFFAKRYVSGTKWPDTYSGSHIKDFCENLIANPFLSKSLPP